MQTVEKIVISNIKQFINAKGLKQKFVAEKMGLSPQELSNILNGRKRFETEYVISVCNALNITANELFETAKYEQKGA